MKRTIKDACEIFWGVEKKYHLLDLDIQDVKIWSVIRFRLYRQLTERAGWQEQGHSKNTRLQILKKIPSYLINSFTQNPFFRKKVDVIVLSHPRPKLVNGEVIDIYTKYLIDDLKESNINVLELELDYLGRHDKNLKEHVSYTDFISLITTIFKTCFYIQFSEKEKILIRDVNSELSKEFCFDVDIQHLLLDQIRDFKVKAYIYKKLFFKLCPKVLYICPSYGNSAIISAAKQLDIQVIELQHGTINKYHLGYSYPERIEKLEYFPDKFLVWSEYWKKHSSLPLDKEDIVIRKFDYLEHSKLMYLNCNKKPQIIILSQGNIGNQLAKAVLDNMQLFKGLQIKYKLHPGEFDRYKGYKFLNKLIKTYPYIEVIEDVDLHMLLAESTYQLGVNSTGLFEGLEFNCQTILVDMPGIEYMEDIIESYELKKSGSLYLSEDVKRELMRSCQLNIKSVDD
ncbi:MAG: hypothetical protein COB26_01910 [Piscirickettsiaceae bacterium]|nr:MAG: hypothetical protein COB26_01910 [Piscirickettsiaceae bacterium]